MSKLRKNKDDWDIRDQRSRMRKWRVRLINRNNARIGFGRCKERAKGILEDSYEFRSYKWAKRALNSAFPKLCAQTAPPTHPTFCHSNDQTNNGGVAARHLRLGVGQVKNWWECRLPGNNGARSGDLQSGQSPEQWQSGPWKTWYTFQQSGLNVVCEHKANPIWIQVLSCLSVCEVDYQGIVATNTRKTQRNEGKKRGGCRPTQQRRK